MGELRAIACPVCGRPCEWSDPAQAGRLSTANRYEDCLRRCDEHGIGWSNGKTNPTRIYRDPLANVPAEVRDGIDVALRNAVNERNRENKRRKFGFSTSEDAVTWTLFSFLRRQGRLGRILGAAPDTEASVDEKAAMLLWGAPVPRGDPEADRVRNELIRISDALGESPSSRSEPDVIVDLGAAGVVFVEVKFQSGNDIQETSHRGWELYVNRTSAFSHIEAIRSSGLYELARNWRIAWDLAGDRPMTLVNLGLSKLFRGEGGRRLCDVASALRTTPTRRFLPLRWADLIARMTEVPSWLRCFIAERELDA